MSSANRTGLETGHIIAFHTVTPTFQEQYETYFATYFQCTQWLSGIKGIQRSDTIFSYYATIRSRYR